MNSQVFTKRALRDKQVVSFLNKITYTSVRCAGGAAHHRHPSEHDDHQGAKDPHHTFQKSNKMDTMFKIPTQEDLDYQLPKKGNMTERFHQWLAGRWPVDRDDILQNDKPNKFAAYYWFHNYSLLQNGLVLGLVRVLFDNHRIHHKSHHEGLGGVKVHENSLFLYKSNQGDSLIRSRMMDWLILVSAGGFVVGHYNFLVLPLAAAAFALPRKVAALQYFTFHAELLPHTEQVVFHKVGLGGSIRRIYVDIKNLEKIEADVVPSPFLFMVNIFDPNMVFRDMETKEIFVFDSNGIWNEDTLKHKLLY